MSQQPESDREDELDTLRQRLCDLERRCRELERRAPRSLRPRWSRKFLLGTLPAVLLVSGGLLYAQGDALFIDEKGVGIEKDLEVKGDAAFGGKVGIRKGGTIDAYLTFIDGKGVGVEKNLDVKGGAAFGGKVDIGQGGTNDVYLTVQGRMWLPNADAGIWFGSSKAEDGGLVGRVGGQHGPPRIGFHTPFARSLNTSNYWPLQVSTRTGHVGIGTEPDDQAKLKVAGRLSVTETATIQGLLTAKQYKPVWASEWVRDDSKTNHPTVFKHGLGYIPAQITVYFSPDGKGEKVYPVSLSRYETVRGNPVTTEVTKNEVILHIYSGNSLHETWSPSTRAWSQHNEGYWRVVLF